MLRKTRCPAVGKLVQFNSHYIDVRDVLYELIERLYIVTMIDENNLLTLHSYPEEAEDISIAMGIEPRLLLDRYGEAL